jgi:hypothetical protein
VVLNNHSSSSCSKWGEITHSAPQGSVFGPLLFLLYINDLPQITNKNSKIVLFAYDTNIIITNSNPSNFKNSVNKIIQDINEWLNTNSLSLNLDKTHFTQFVTKNNSSIAFKIMYRNNKIANVYNTNFLGLTLENTLSWRTHIDSIIPKLSSASFALRVVKPFLSQNLLKMVYYSYFHSMTYGLIFWGNSHYSNIIFRLQKRMIRIIVGIRVRDSCREHFKKLKKLPLQSQYILSGLLFIVDNGDYFKVNSEIHNIKSTESWEFLHSIQRNIINVDKRFKRNSLLLNMDKTHLLQFYTKIGQIMDLEVHYENKQITAVNTIKFLGLIIYSTLSWKQHIDSIISKLNRACFAIRQVKPYMALVALKTIYFSYFHSIVTYGIIFWGNSVHSQYIFKIQKRMIRLIANLGVRDSCCCVLKNWGFYPCIHNTYIPYSCLWLKTEICFKPILMSTHLAQDIKMISTCHQQN